MTIPTLWAQNGNISRMFVMPIQMQLTATIAMNGWLWEEYLNTFLSGLLFHPRNKTEEGKLFLFEKSKGECYPDFYNKEKRIVLDAKYKGYADWGKVQNPDIYQVISYMHILKANKGGFLVPKEGERQAPRQFGGKRWYDDHYWYACKLCL